MHGLGKLFGYRDGGLVPQATAQAVAQRAQIRSDIATLVQHCEALERKVASVENVTRQLEAQLELVPDEYNIRALMKQVLDLYKGAVK